MKNKKIFIVALIFVAIIVVGFFVFNKSQPPSRFAAINGWLFEIKTDQGIEKFMVRFGSWPNNTGKVITEDELIKLIRTGKWTPPFEKHSKEEWLAQCDKRQEQKRDCSEEAWQSECSGSDAKSCLASFEYWQQQCEIWNTNLMSCYDSQYEDYEPIMLSYLQENGIEGEIINSYVGYFMVAGSGLNFPKARSF